MYLDKQIYDQDVIECFTGEYLATASGGKVLYCFVVLTD